MNFLFTKNVSLEGMLGVGGLRCNLSSYAKVDKRKMQLVKFTRLFCFQGTFGLKEKCSILFGHFSACCWNVRY